MLVLGISGSLRRESHNTRLLGAAGEIIRAHGSDFELFDDLRAIPPYCEDDDVGSCNAVMEALVPGVEAFLHKLYSDVRFVEMSQ